MQLDSTSYEENKCVECSEQLSDHSSLFEHRLEKHPKSPKQNLQTFQPYNKNTSMGPEKPESLTKNPVPKKKSEQTPCFPNPTMTKVSVLRSRNNKDALSEYNKVSFGSYSNVYNDFDVRFF